MSRVPIGLELFSVRNELAEDARGTIKAVAEMGYEGVEFAGGALVGILERYPGRAGTVHLKPFTILEGDAEAHAGFRPIIGEDSVQWDEIFRVCETTGGTEWYIVEYESDAYPPLEAVERCLSALKAMGK